MAKQTINVGTGPNTGAGDALRDALIKVNENFDEVYADIAALEDGDITTDIKGNVFAEDSTLLVDAVNGIIPWAVVDSTPTTLVGYGITDAFDGEYSSLTNKPTIPNLAAVNQSIIPDTDVAYDLGSASNRFRDLYLSGNTIDLGGALISASPTGSLVLPPNTSIPGVKELAPVSIIDDRQGQTYYNGSPVVADSTIIDQATFLWAQGGGFETDFNPSTYSATVDGSGNITDITLVTARNYGLAGEYFATINSDNMVAIDPGIDITDPAAIVASVQVEILSALVASDFANVTLPGYISLADLKTLVAASIDFDDFKTRIAAL